jgi:glycosyltransferase involved in cell wall biosynthesis
MSEGLDQGARSIRVLYVLHSGSLAGSAESLCVLLEHFPPGAVRAAAISPPGEVVDRLRQVGAAVRVVPGISMLHSIEGVPLRGRRLLELARTLWMTRYGGQLRAAIRATGADIVHLNERGMLHAATIAHGEGVPVVMHARSVAETRESWVRRLSAEAIRRHVDRVIAIDESVRRSLGDLANIEVIYNPLSRQTLARNAAASSPPPAPDRGGPVRVTYLTGLQVFKGIWDLLECALLLRYRRDIIFQIAGSNSRPAAFHRSLRGRVLHLAGFAPDVDTSVRRWVARHGMEGTVRLLGRVEPDAALAATDVLVFPSHLNGPGRSVFEAGAYGVPAVMALRDKVEDVVVNEVTGLIVPERDPRALARAIERLADSPELRAFLGRNARARCLRQFAPAPIARQVLALYRSLLASRGSEAGALARGGSGAPIASGTLP